MSSYTLYLLPAIAAAILLQGSLVTIKGNLLYRSKRFKHRLLARVFLFRMLVIALLLSTVVTTIWPLPQIPALLQGVAMTLLLMLPVTIYAQWRRHLADRRLDRRESDSDTEQSSSDGANLPHSATSVEAVDKAKVTSPSATMGLGNSEAPLPTDGTESISVERRGVNTEPHTEPPGITSLLSRESNKPDTEEDALDQTLSVSEQLEGLDKLVNFHNIGDENLAAGTARATSANERFDPLENAIAIARKGILEEPSLQQQARENLPARSRAELAEMVGQLRSDKVKLQKLVIAQQSVIDAEKQAHERTRVVVKDAISVMRNARHGQRIAEKIARRERAERQRLEKDVDKLKKQMNNAISTITHDRETEPEAP